MAPSMRWRPVRAKRMHQPIPEQGRWLARVLHGHYNYYAVPDNIEALE
jgi:RNA-directed DNA polymerase